MKMFRTAALIGGIGLGGLAGAALQQSSVSAAPLTGTHASNSASAPVATPTAGPSCPTLKLAIAFTKSVTDTSALGLHLPWGRAGDPEGRMIEDYGAFNGLSIRATPRVTTPT